MPFDQIGGTRHDTRCGQDIELAIQRPHIEQSTLDSSDPTFASLAQFKGPFAYVSQRSKIPFSLSRETALAYTPASCLE